MNIFFQFESPKMKVFKYLSLLAFLFIFASSTFAQISNPSGELRPVADDDIWPQTLEGSYYNEFWTYHFYLNDGLKVHITFSVANFGSLKSAVSGVQVSVDRLDGELYQLSREYNINHLHLDKEKYMFRNRLERDLFFEGKLPDQHRVRINTEKDGIAYDIDLQLHNIFEGIKWGDGKYSIDDEKVGIITHIPYAEVKGYVEVNGKRKNVAGTAYMDHTFQNQTTTRLVDSGYRFIYHDDAYNWNILFLMLPEETDEKRTIGYHLTNQNGEVSVAGVENIEYMSKRNLFGEDVARIIELNLNNGKTLRLTRMDDTEKFSVLGELGRVARSVARRFLGGEVIHFRGEATLLETGERSKRGHYNFFIVS